MGAAGIQLVMAASGDAAQEAAQAAQSTGDGSGTIGIITLLTIFVLAVFVGFEIITKVPPTLHTPLMSGSNAISGITIVGALLATDAGATTAATVLGFLAIAMATTNVVGGYLVTHRMLGMFQRKG